MFRMTCYNVAGPSGADEAKISEAADWIDSGASDKLPGFGWVKLPDEDISQVLETARWLRRFDSVIQVGIGGSSLGNLMLHQALLPPYYNERKDRKGPRFYMADNLDGGENQAIWDLVDPDNTGIIVVSKSGRTLETMANFLYFWEKLDRKSVV